MLCRKMVRLGMLNTLPKERIWNEIEKALHTTNFHLFLKNLELCNALPVVLPEIAGLTDVKEPLEYHPEGKKDQSEDNSIIDITSGKLAELTFDNVTIEPLNSGTGANPTSSDGSMKLYLKMKCIS